jgi:cholesterol oxidase
VDLLKSANPFGWARRSLVLLVMQVFDNSLRMVYRRTWLRPWKKTLQSTAPDGGVPTFLPEANQAARAIAAKCNAIPCTAVTEVLLNRPLTAHVIGGCSMGADRASGVVDKHGAVFGHPGLYVADGSIISANLGANPSLTITALAEHVMSAIPASGPKPPPPIQSSGA